MRTPLAALRNLEGGGTGKFAEGMHISEENHKSLKCFYTNANSLTGKMDELRERISGKSYDVIAITETWANHGITDAELSLDGFNLYRKDRAAKRAGGIALYINEALQANTHMDLIADDQESLWCSVKCHKTLTLVGVCYRCPDSTDSYNDNLLKIITTLQEIRRLVDVL